MTRQHARRASPRPVWVVALALIALLLGHDLLMAAPLAPVGSAHHGVAKAGGDASHNAPASSHPEACGATTEAVARAVDTTLEGPAIIGLLPALARLPTQFRSPVTQPAPSGRPPSRARALLQVYRL